MWSQAAVDYAGRRDPLIDYGRSLSAKVRTTCKMVTYRQLLAAVWGPAHEQDVQYPRLRRPVAPEDRA